MGGWDRSKTTSGSKANPCSRCRPVRSFPAYPVNAPGFTAGPAIVLAAAGNDIHVDPDTGDTTLNVLTDILGPVEVVAVGPAGSPLPVTGNCSRCGSATIVYGPAGSPLCDRCRDGGASRPAKDAGDC